jgi:hypothetical protein
LQRKKYTGEQTGSNPSWDDRKFEPKLLVLIVIIAQNITAKKHESPQNRRWGQLIGEKTMVQSLYLKIVVSLLHQELFYKTLLQVQVTLNLRDLRLLLSWAIQLTDNMFNRIEDRNCLISTKVTK